MNKIHFLVLLGLLPLCTFAQGIQITHGPYLQAVGENDVTIVWTTNQEAVSWVELAPAGDDSFYAQEHPVYYQTKDGNRTVTKLHKVKISGLTKGTEYRYRIFSKEVRHYRGQNDVLYGKVAATDVYSKNPLRFRTFDGDKPDVSFKIVNDIHNRISHLRALCKDVAYGQTDLMIFNGDMVSTMADETSFFAGFMDEAVRMYASEVPVFYARGNHETRGKFNMHFSSYFPTSTDKLYYSFRQGPAFFIVLDSGEDKPDSDIAYSGLAQFDAYRSEQQEWLKNILRSNACQSAKYKIVIVHIPPIEDDWHGTVEVREKFLPILNNAGITAMFCGHTHRYGYEKPTSQHDFPILINAADNVLDIKATSTEIKVSCKDLDGKELNFLDYKIMFNNSK
jgi:Icc-related predicted phosphoesterase